MCNLSSRRYTLLEACIVLSMLAILAALGVGSMREHLPRYRLVQTAKQFKSDMMQLRAIAVQNNREARMRLQSAENYATKHGSGVASGYRSLGIGRWPQPHTGDPHPKIVSTTALTISKAKALSISAQAGNQQANDILQRGSWGGLAGPDDNGANNADSVGFSPIGAGFRNPSGD